MAWDFAAEIHALTGFDADDTSTTATSGETLSAHASQWLTDGAKEIMNILSKNPEYINLITTSNTLNSSSTTLSLNNGRAINVVLNDGTRVQACRRIDAARRGRANDVNDLMNYATTSDPVYWIKSGVLEVFPTPSDSNEATIETLNYPTVAYSDVSINSFPDEAERLVVMYASLKALEYMMLTEEDVEVFGPQLIALRRDYRNGISLLSQGALPELSKKEREEAI
jgi:hypothetical protein